MVSRSLHSLQLNTGRECFQSGFFSPLCACLFSCAALGGSSSGSWAALCRLLLFGDGRLCFAFEGLGGVQLVQMYVSRRIRWTDLAVEYQRLVQWGPLLRRQEAQTVTTNVNWNIIMSDVGCNNVDFFSSIFVFCASWICGWKHCGFYRNMTELPSLNVMQLWWWLFYMYAFVDTHKVH